LIEVTVALHQQDLVPANSYVLDLDAIQENSELIARHAAAHRLQAFAMTKQIGRNPPALRAIAAGGIERFAAVDVTCARAIHATSQRIGNVGHLVQIPKREIAEIGRYDPLYWTVFSYEQAAAISRFRNALGASPQALLLRVRDPADIVVESQAGWTASELPDVLEDINRLPGVRVAGVTAFPALTIHERTGKPVVSPNLRTATGAAATLARLGIRHPEINAPGHNAASTLQLLSSYGVTQVEPGHALTGTTPLKPDTDIAERPAIVYVTEVSHVAAGNSYCFGGGLYVCGGARDRTLRGLIGRDAEEIFSQRITAVVPAPPGIDFYARLFPEQPLTIRPGDTVIFAFRPQAFVTRAYVAPLTGLAQDRARVEGIWTVEGQPSVACKPVANRT
jgi:predicted amino acid racemase